MVPHLSGFSKTFRACQFFHVHYISTSQLSLFKFYSLLPVSAVVKINHQVCKICVQASTFSIRKGRVSVIFFIYLNYLTMPVPVAARSKAWVCGRSPAETVGSNPTGGMDICLLGVLYIATS